MHYWVAPDIIESYGSTIVATYMIVDVLCQPKMTTIFRWHHAFACALCVREMVASNTFANNEIRKVFIETELSTLVLCCLHMWKNQWILFAFSCMFVYCRIFKIAYVYFMHVNEWDLCRDIPAMGLYALNCHWFFGILAKWDVSEALVDGAIWLSTFLLMYQGFMTNPVSLVLMVRFFAYDHGMASCLYLLWLLKDQWLSFLPCLTLLFYYHLYDVKKKKFQIKEAEE